MIEYPEASSSQLLYSKRESGIISKMLNLIITKYPSYLILSHFFSIIYDTFNHYSFEKNDVIAQSVITMSFAESSTIKYI